MGIKRCQISEYYRRKLASDIHRATIPPWKLAQLLSNTLPNQ
jgi:hypothetical protein